MDFLGVELTSGKLEVFDGYVTSSGTIRKESSRDIEGLNLDLESNKIFVEVGRPLNAVEKNDLDLSQCIVISYIEIFYLSAFFLKFFIT